MTSKCNNLKDSHSYSVSSLHWSRISGRDEMHNSSLTSNTGGVHCEPFRTRLSGLEDPRQLHSQVWCPGGGSWKPGFSWDSHQSLCEQRLLHHQASYRETQSSQREGAYNWKWIPESLRTWAQQRTHISVIIFPSMLFLRQSSIQKE